MPADAVGATRLRSWWLAAGGFVLVLGARWAWIDRFGIALPFMDQWDAEARTLLLPWLRGERGLALFLRPHNEHRVVLTRVLALVLTLANRQWDQRLECVLNAFFAAGLAAAFIGLTARRWGLAWGAAGSALLAVLFATPASWENIVRGFDSQQFFLIGLSAAAIGLIALPRRPGTTWGLGLGCLVLALGSMASGALAAVPVAAATAVRMRKEPDCRAPGWAALAVCGAVFAVGLGTQVHVPGHDVLRAHSVGEFLRTLLGELGWPASFHGFGAVGALLWVPCAVLTVRFLPPALAGRSSSHWNTFVLGLGLWTLLQLAATAYARSGGGGPPATRYLDLLYVGLIANALAAVTLLHVSDCSRTCRRSCQAMAIGWLLLVACGLGAEERTAWQFLNAPPFGAENRYEEANVRHYLATGDAGFLHHAEIPYPSELLLGRWLDDPELRGLLPSSVRPSLVLATAKADGFETAFTPPMERASVHGGRVAAGAVRASWRSRSLQAKVGGWLEFPVIGDLGRLGTRLDLRDSGTGRLLAEIEPSRIPGPSWHSAEVRAPDRPFFVEASCDSGAWFAFGDPVEMGRLSHAAWRAARRGPWVAAAGLVVLLAALAAPQSRPIMDRARGLGPAGRTDTLPAPTSS